MTTTCDGRRGPRPLLGWVVAAGLMHLLVLDGVPHRQAPAAATRQAPTLWTRSIDPAPPPAASSEPAPAQPVAIDALRPPSPTPRATRPTGASQGTSSPSRAPAASPSVVHTDPPRAAASPPPVSTATQAVLAPVRVAGAAALVFDVSGVARGEPYETEARLDWQRQADRYRAVWSVNGPQPAMRTQRSEGAITAAGLVPERFSERARGENAAHFDADEARIRFSANTPDAPLLPGSQDRLSALLQLGALLAAAPERYPSGSVIRLPTAGTRGADTWDWQVQDDEELQLAGRTLHAVKLVRPPPMQYAPLVELWLARELAFLPVRLRVTQGQARRLDQRLRAIEATP